MILLFNIFLTNSSLKHRYDRGLLHSDNNFDIFKYCIASIAPIYNWSQVILNIKLDACFLYRQDELTKYLYELFPYQSNFQLNLGFRNEYQKDWIKTIESFVDDELIFHSCNHDHIFLDSNVDYFNYCIQTLKKREKETGIFTISHYAEMTEASKTRDYSIDGLLVYLDAEGSDSFIITTKNWFKKWWETIDLGEERWIRSDGIHGRVGLPKQDFFAVPSRELFRHFDGYRNVCVPNVEHFMRYFPPLSIPKGFFEKDIRISYDLPDIRDGVNIGFTHPNSSINQNGIDYQYMLKEFPLVWKDRISRITINTDQNKDFETNFPERLNLIKEYLSRYTNKDSKIYDYYLDQNKSFIEYLYGKRSDFRL